MLGSHTTLAQRLAPRQGLLARPLVRDGALALAGTLLLTLCARISFPIPTTPVPVTMQTFAVLLLSALYGPRLGAATMLLYLAEGLAGLPVFAGGRSAWSPSSVPALPVIIGPTAGYLLSWPVVALLVGALAERGWDRTIRSALPAMLLGSLVILICGFAWLAAATWLISGRLNVAGLLGAAVLPFLPGDALKLVLAALALPGGWALLRDRG
ncbi:MAG TPA: biotin transporter BioY [Kouleothrix sp.]|uniref:biotin transporter BioY n=1 Tax=Kouleothrix sp. TaxID=2779161 RepID=UPI002C0E9E24|nr:biotin transporter BioY [Kouleothrix sp.]HRC75090.1 biotin transporter BioY [Kouleothrix sp.]